MLKKLFVLNLAAAAILVLGSTNALAQEPTGCIDSTQSTETQAQCLSAQVVSLANTIYNYSTVNTDYGDVFQSQAMTTLFDLERAALWYNDHVSKNADFSATRDDFGTLVNYFYIATNHLQAFKESFQPLAQNYFMLIYQRLQLLNDLYKN